MSKIEAKLFEVRDRGTLLVCMGVRMGADDYAEAYLHDRAGYGNDEQTRAGYVLFGVIDPDAGHQPEGAARLGFNYDPDEWRWSGPERLRHAHAFIIEHWREIRSGDVIDIQFILGETTAPKVSDRAQR